MIGRDWPQLAPLSDDERGEVHRLLAKFGEERAARADAHRKRLAGTARYLGREVRAHRVALAEAERRLDALASELDPESPTPLALLPWREAHGVVRDAFREAFRG